MADSMDMTMSNGQTLGDGEGQGDLACYSPWDYRVGHDLATDSNKLYPEYTSHLELLRLTGICVFLKV